MANTLVDGVRLDYVRKCSCGRSPEISTAYEGFEPGFGPFLIRCYCDTPDDAVNEHGLRPQPTLSRSWSKTRVVRNWNRLVRTAQATTRPGGSDA